MLRHYLDEKARNGSIFNVTGSVEMAMARRVWHALRCMFIEKHEWCMGRNITINLYITGAGSVYYGGEGFYKKLFETVANDTEKTVRNILKLAEADGISGVRKEKQSVEILDGNHAICYENQVVYEFTYKPASVGKK